MNKSRIKSLEKAVKKIIDAKTPVIVKFVGDDYIPCPEDNSDKVIIVRFGEGVTTADAERWAQ